MDFLRTVIHNSKRKDNPNSSAVLFIGQNMDVPALVAGIYLLITQACQQARASVFRTVSKLRDICGCNVVSNFAMYKFIYDCLLQTMTSTMTILTKFDFVDIFNQLKRKPAPEYLLNGIASEKYLNMASVRNKLSGLQFQFLMIKKLSRMYHKRLFPNEKSSIQDGTGVVPSQNHSFAAKLFNHTIWYLQLPTYHVKDQIMAIRGSVSIEDLLLLMESRRSRSLIWISESFQTKNLSKLAQGKVQIKDIQYFVSHCSFTLATPKYAVEVFMFGHWSMTSGVKPQTSPDNVLKLLHHVQQRTMENISKDSSDVITIYENKGAVEKNRKGSAKRNDIWRGVMLACALYIGQRMQVFGEVDIFRTCQMFKMFDPFHVFTSFHQYTWLFKMAWASLKSREISTEGVELETSTLSSPRSVQLQMGFATRKKQVKSLKRHRKTTTRSRHYVNYNHRYA